MPTSAHRVPARPTTPQHRCSTRTGRRRARTLAAVLAALALVAASVTVAVGSPTVQLLVDSVEQAADANPGDGVCATAAGECTLRAAIEESNALNRGAGEVAIGVHPDFAGGRIDVVATTSTWMRTTSVSSGGSISGDGGAIFEVTAPVSIDLEHKVTAAPVDSLDGPGAALFHLNGPDITLTGIDQSWTGETTFYVGPSASNVLITGGSITTPNYYPERFIVVRGGASNVTVSDYTIQGYASTESANWGWGFVDGAGTTPVEGLTFDNVSYLSELSGSCGTSSALGCSSTPVSMAGQKVTTLTFSNNTLTNLGRASSDARLMNLRSATVADLVVSGNTITNARMTSGSSLIDMGVAGYGANLTNVTITDNVFTDLQVAGEEMNGVIRLPANKSIAGTGLIARNTMLAGDAQSQAIYWDGPYSDAVNVSASNVVIEQNHFDGFGDSSSRSTIRLYQTGAVTVRQNTFGTATGTQTNTVTEEGTASGSYATTMLNNWSYGANGKMNTWFPTARTAANVQATVLQAQSCTVDLEVTYPGDGDTSAISSARSPVTPTTLDVYWTAERTAEVYLESVTVTDQSRQTLTISLPLAGDERLAHLADGATLPVDATTGAVSGGLRVQTQDPNAGATTASSQFSRVALIGGTCLPELTIDQAEDQNDPTVARDLHYTVTSTIALDSASVTVEDIGVTAQATEETVDADRLNPRVISVAEVAGSGGTVFDVVVRVDDSALVTATLDAGAVTSTAGMANGSAATSTDNEITFVSPLVVTPARFTLVTGEPNGKDYTISTRAGAPVPTADLAFTADVDATGASLGVTVSTTTPVLAAGGESTDPVTVLAAAGDVTANTAVLVAHTVTSADLNYDGLVVAPARAFLFSTDPTLQITKQAYTEVTDSSSPAQIQATGTEALSGARLMDGQAVCFVYTVTNTSADDWATVLSGIDVTDTDTRLGTNGLIGTIPILGIGESVQLSACAVLIPVDTTAGSTS